MSYGFNKPRTQAAIASIAQNTDKMYKDSDTGWISECSHAEVGALKKAACIVDTVVVVRKTKGGSLGCSRPCNICMEYMRQAGVEKVYYLNPEADFEQELL